MMFRETHGRGGNGPATAWSLSRSSRLRPGALRAPAASAASAPRELSQGHVASSAATWEHREGQTGTGDGAPVEGAHPKAGWECCLQCQASGVCGEGAHKSTTYQHDLGPS